MAAGVRATDRVPRAARRGSLGADGLTQIYTRVKTHNTLCAKRHMACVRI